MAAVVFTEQKRAVTAQRSCVSQCGVLVCLGISTSFEVGELFHGSICLSIFKSGLVYVLTSFENVYVLTLSKYIDP